MSATSTRKNVTAATSGAQVTTGACTLSGINFTPTATGNSCILYDNAAGDTSGDILVKLLATSVDSQTVLLPNIEVKYGVSIALTGATSVACIYGHGLG